MAPAFHIVDSNANFGGATFNEIARDLHNHYTIANQSQDTTIGYDDSSAQIWSVYVSQAEKHDKALVESWKGDMKSVLIFAGLFSAVVTAFIMQSYLKLQANPSDMTVVLLTQISLQLAAMSNSSHPDTFQPVSDQTQFKPTTSTLVVNALWFLSLGFSLTSAFAATLVQQWARSYLQVAERRSAPVARARIRAYLYHGLERFGMGAVVEAIPTLLQMSLSLFFAGLVAFLYSINTVIAYLTLGILVISTGSYLVITVLPIINFDCPFRTPLSLILWRAMQIIMPLLMKRTEPVMYVHNMVQAREKEAITQLHTRDMLDRIALRWTMETLTENNDLELFIDGIPGYITSNRATGMDIIRNLLKDKDSDVQLGTRIAELLLTCRTDGLLLPDVRKKRVRTCATAIFTLVTESQTINCEPEMWRDVSQTVAIMQSVSDTARAAGLEGSTTCVVMSNLLRSAKAMIGEEDLGRLDQELDKNQTVDLQRASALLNKAWQELDELTSPSFLTSTPDIILSSESANVELEWDGPVHMLRAKTAVLRNEMENFTERDRQSRTRVLNLTRNMLQLRRTLHQFLNDVHFAILINFIIDMQKGDTSREASTTVRAIAYGLDTGPKSLPNQERFVKCLLDVGPPLNPPPDEAVSREGSLQEVSSPTRSPLLDSASHPAIRVPSGIIEILLRFVSVLDTQRLIEQTISIIDRYRGIQPGGIGVELALSTLRLTIGAVVPRNGENQLY